MSYLKAFWITGTLLISLLLLCGLVGGIFADIPGVSDDDTGKYFFDLASKIVKTILHLLGNRPIGVIVAWVVVASFYWLFTHDHVNSLKAEQAENRRNSRVNSRKNPRKKGKSQKSKHSRKPKK